MNIGWARPAVVALAVAIGSTAHAGLAPKGKPAPAWSGKTVQGKAISSSQLKGKVVLMNFFSYY